MAKFNKKAIWFSIGLTLIILLGGFVLLKKSKLFDIDKFSSAYEEIQTDSGLKVLFSRDDSLPFIQYRMFFPKGGADYDFKGKSGLAVLTAYLSDQGAGGLSATVLHEELNQLGTELEIGVGRQVSKMVLSGLSWHAGPLWNLFEKIISEPHFKEEEMEILRKQFLEKRLKNLDQPSFVANAVWRKRLFEGTVGSDRSGSIVSLSKITLEDIKRFYKNQYLEGNPILMVSGQYDEALKKNIISFFNDRFSYQSQTFKAVSIPDREPEFKLLTNANLDQAQIHLGHAIGSFPVDKPREFLVLKVANFILGAGSMSSRLFVGLREEKGLTYGVYSGIDFGKLYGVFIVGGSTKTSSVREFLEDTLLILKNFKEKGVSLEEVQRAKQNLKSQHLNDIETPENRLQQYIYYTHYLGVNPNFLNNYLNILDDISLDEVNKLIKKFVLSKALQVLVYGHPSLKNQLEDIEGLAPLQKVSFEDYFKEELKLRPHQ